MALEAAKIYHVRQTQHAFGEIKLRPLWADSWKVKGADGNIKVAVPTIENRISNNSVNILRLFNF